MTALITNYSYCLWFQQGSVRYHRFNDEDWCGGNEAWFQKDDSVMPSWWISPCNDDAYEKESVAFGFAFCSPHILFYFINEHLRMRGLRSATQFKVGKTLGSFRGYEKITFTSQKKIEPKTSPIQILSCFTRPTSWVSLILFGKISPEVP